MVKTFVPFFSLSLNNKVVCGNTVSYIFPVVLLIIRCQLPGLDVRLVFNGTGPIPSLVGVGLVYVLKIRA